MPGKVSPVPEGFHTLSPHITVNNAAEAIGFYEKAFGAEVIARMPGPDGESVMHAELQIGTSRIMLNDEFPGMGPKSPKSLGGSPVVLHLYVDDVDSLYDRAVKAGATATLPVNDAFWGDRYGQLQDPFGHTWSLATRTEDLTPEQIGERAKDFFAKMEGGKE